LAESRPDLNILGIEIREQLVEEAQRLSGLAESENLRFLAGSANTVFGPCCDSLRGSSLRSCSIQFPDPWPKRAHRKRRVVQPELVADIAARLQPSVGFVFLQSDVEELAAEMRDCFLASGHFKEAPLEQRDAQGWLLDEARPFAVRTERERQAARRRLPVWRALLTRKPS